MVRERNLDSIRASEKQIQEHERAIIKLKRARNSLLNVSTFLPPEVLGSIFRWNVIPDGDFGGLTKGSYNFLLVCHHWFQVASGTPGLWSFWGNSIEDWARRRAHYSTAPLDLVLRQYTSRNFGGTLHNTLQDRAARDTIRRVHLKCSDPTNLLNPIISSITAKGEETRSISVESFIMILQNFGGLRVDVSNFFSRYHFPKLHRLELCGFSISSWDLLGSRTTSLTTLSLTYIGSSPLPTLSQMLSILSANPNLQSLVLHHGSVPDADSDRSSSRIQLRHLKRLYLGGDLHAVLGFLNRLEFTDRLDHLKLSLDGCSPSDFSQTLGPFLGNHIRRRSPDRLKFLANPKSNCFSFLVGDAREGNSIWEGWSITMCVTTNITSEKEAENLFFDITAHIPLEEVVCLTTTLPILRSEELYIRMCNVARLHLTWVDLSTQFVEPDIHVPHVKDLLSGLHSITITNLCLSDGNWSPLTNFLARRAAVGNRISSLGLSRYPHMGEGVVESIRGAVEVFEDGGSDGTGWSDDGCDGWSDESDGKSDDGSDDESDNGSDDSY
jgi:hypothetical protein